MVAIWFTRLRAPQMLGQRVNLSRAPAVLALPLCGGAWPLAVHRHCSLSEHGQMQSCQGWSLSSYPTAVRSLSENLYACTTRCPTPLMASSSASRPGQGFLASLQVSFPVNPNPAPVTTAELCAAHTFQMEAVLDTKPRPAEAGSCLSPAPEAYRAREDPQDASSPDESHVPSHSTATEGLQGTRLVPSATATLLPSETFDKLRQHSQVGEQPAEPCLPPPPSVGVPRGGSPSGVSRLLRNTSRLLSPMVPQLPSRGPSRR